ncbi:MAG TPA: DNA translocase FtsK, partial [Phycisphaerae bacterium]|nr:DNA translocase FtsK [Phycisphaerae bacterium]
PNADYLRPDAAVQNRCGIIGAYIAYYTRYFLGVGSYATLVCLTLWSLRLMSGRAVPYWTWRMTGMFVLTAGISAGAYMLQPNLATPFAETSAGILGSYTGTLLGVFGPMGQWLVLGIVLCIGLVFAADNFVAGVLAALKKLFAPKSELAIKFAELKQKRKEEKERLKAAKLAAVEEARKLKEQEKRRRKEEKEQARQAAIAEKQAAKAAADENASAMQAEQQSEEAVPEDIELQQDILLEDIKTSSAETSAAIPSPSGSAPLFGDIPKPQPPQKQKSAPKPKKTRKTDLELPSLSLLDEPQRGYSEKAEVSALQRKITLQQTLDDFGVQANVEGYMTGPVITLFEVALAPGVKVAAISNLATDIARSLAVPGVRIVPPRFGKNTVGIEVPNVDKEIVRLKELVNLQPDAPDHMELPLYLGKDAGGNPIITDLAKCPHMLIAGTTGSGKSVCINTIIMSLLLTRQPEDVRFILVDPKMVEMAAFEKLPYLLCPTINDTMKAESILEWATIKMDERYEILREAGVKNLASFNELSEKEIYEAFQADTPEEQARVVTHMPSIIIIIDELADMMMTSGKEVESYIIRIAQKARAVGIHLVLATQRPSANVVTGLIKSNMPCRVSFRVASGQESRIVLDQKGAEVLLGQGDMLVLQPGSSTLERAQGTYVSDSEIRKVCRQIESQCEQVFDEELIKLESAAAGDDDGFEMERDELFDESVEIILSARRGSVSLLQRRLQIGYGRASRIIDQMAAAGILGDHKGSQARECLMTLDEWLEMKEATGE